LKTAGRGCRSALEAPTALAGFVGPEFALYGHDIDDTTDAGRKVPLEWSIQKRPWPTRRGVEPGGQYIFKGDRAAAGH